MRSKSLGILVRTLLFGMFLIIPSSVYADAFSFTVVNLNNLQITSSGGNITFGVWQASVFVTAGHNLGGVTEQNTRTASNSDVAIATAVDNFGVAAGLADATTLFIGGASNADVRNCLCAASSTGRAALFNTFMISGADGPVEVNISGLLDRIQNLFTNGFGVVSQSQTNVTFFVDSFTVFSMEFPRFIGPNSMDFLHMSQQVAGAITVQSNTQHTVTISVQADSSAVEAVPEPTTAVLLLSGLGSLISLVKRRRGKFWR